MLDVGQNRSPFSVYVPLVKAYDSPDGKSWVFEAPLSEPGKDLQHERMNMAGLRKGLDTFRRLDMPVDWDHLWERTREPKYLIGKGISLYDAPHPKTGEDVPHIRGVLFKSKELARQAREHWEACQAAGGGGLGISVAGHVVRRDPLDKSHILETAISSVALTPTPVADSNSGTLQFLKAFSAAQDAGVDDISKSVFPYVPELHSRLLPVWTVGDAELHLDAMRKAMEATGAIPRSGPGANALETECMVGGGKKKASAGDADSEDEDEAELKTADTVRFKKAYEANLALNLRHLLTGLRAHC